MDLEDLAVTVDRIVHAPAAQRGSGRLYAVRCTPDTAGDSASQEGAGTDPAGVVLELLAEGEARTLPQKVRPPAGVRAIALASGVWAAPMDDDLLHRSPRQHPERRRAHLTVLVGGEGERDAVDVSVLRYSGSFGLDTPGASSQRALVAFG